MEAMAPFLASLGRAMAPGNLLCLGAGGVLGTLLGVLPGVGPVAALALLLPLAYVLPPLQALTLLLTAWAGVRCGQTLQAMAHTPAAAAQGGALAGALVASALAAVACAGLLVAWVPLLAGWALGLGPVEQCALLVLGLVGAVAWVPGGLLKSLATAVAGLLLGLVGKDMAAGINHLGGGMAEPAHAISLAAMALGLFVYGPLISHLAQGLPAQAFGGGPLRAVWPSRQDVTRQWPAAVQGVAVPAALLVLLALGIPAQAVPAVLLGAMGIHNTQPGPALLLAQPDLVWGLLAALVLGPLLLLLNLPLLGLWGRLMAVPYRWVFPALVLLGALGVYAIHGQAWDVGLVAAFGLLGYGMAQLGLARTPLLLGFLLAPTLAERLHSALAHAQGDWGAFVSRPVSLGLLLAALAWVVVAMLPAAQVRRAAAAADS